MKASNQAMTDLCESLAQEIGAGVDFELELGELIGKYRRKHDRRMVDAEADRLLPLGPSIAAERQSCHRVTVYRRAARARVAAKKPLATTPA